MATTHNYWNLKNEHFKNLIIISLILVLVIIALIASRILVSALASIGPVISGGNLTEAFKLAIHGTGNFLLTIFVGANIPLPRHLDRLLAFGIMFMVAYVLLKRTRGIEGTIS